MPSFILIHSTVWLQYTNVTDRQTDNGPIAQDELFYEWSPKNCSRVSISLCTNAVYKTVQNGYNKLLSYPQIINAQSCLLE